jgi:hypothetical protein
MIFKRAQLLKLVALSFVAALAACATVVGGCGSPAFQLKLEGVGEADRLKKYTTLVVEKFENDAGEGVPTRVLEDLPDGVIAHLNQCYPLAFVKVTRTTSSSPDELVVHGAITEYDLRRLELVVGVSLADASGEELTRAEGRWGLGIAGAPGMGYLVGRAGREIADGIAKARGVEMQPGWGCSGPGSAG